MTTRTVTIEIPDAIEINNSTDFALWADRFGVQVGTRGRKPKAELVRAIQGYEGDVWPVTIVDTEYFSADMAEDKGRESSPYGAELAAVRKVRDDLIAKANADFEAARTALREKYGREGSATPSGTGAYIVSARTPMLDKSTDDNGNEVVTVRRTPNQGDKPGKVKFLPSVRKVELTTARVRELTGTVGKRGRISDSDTLRAAVLAGEWFPADLMSVDGWDTVLLKDPKVTPVVPQEPVTADTPVADVTNA